MTSYPLMRRDAYDASRDGVVDRAQGVFLTVTAGVGGINAYQVVFLDPATGDGYPADGTNATHAGLVVGMASAAILAAAEGYIQHSGEISNLNWNLDPGCIYYLGAAGTISKTPPVTGFWQKVGVALDSVTLSLQMGEAIKIA